MSYFVEDHTDYLELKANLAIYCGMLAPYRNRACFRSTEPILIPKGFRIYDTKLSVSTYTGQVYEYFGPRIWTDAGSSGTDMTYRMYWLARFSDTIVMYCNDSFVSAVPNTASFAADYVTGDVSYTNDTVYGDALYTDMEEYGDWPQFDWTGGYDNSSIAIAGTKSFTLSGVSGTTPQCKSIKISTAGGTSSVIYNTTNPNGTYNTPPGTSYTERLYIHLYTEENAQGMPFYTINGMTEV